MSPQEQRHLVLSDFLIWLRFVCVNCLQMCRMDWLVRLIDFGYWLCVWFFSSFVLSEGIKVSAQLSLTRFTLHKFSIFSSTTTTASPTLHCVLTDGFGEVVVAWLARTMQIFVSWQLPEEVPVDPQRRWSCATPSHWSCAQRRSFSRHLVSKT